MKWDDKVRLAFCTVKKITMLLEAYSEPCQASKMERYKKKTLFLKATSKLALGWQIAKQLSGLNTLSLSNNKNYRLKKNAFFLCNKLTIAFKQTMPRNSAASKTLSGKFCNHWSCKYRFLEAVSRRCSVKKVFLEISQNS